MKKRKKNGFIATSLIYTFFLAFVALIAALLNNYMSSKTILERYNEEVQDKLNGGAYSVRIRSKNAEIQNGMILQNLVKDGKFKSSSYWTKAGTSTTTFNSTSDKGSSLKKYDSSSSTSYVYQSIPNLTSGKYYFSIDSKYSCSYQAYNYLYLSGYYYLYSYSPSIWRTSSRIISATSSGTGTLYIGLSSSCYGYTAYYSNAMLINLTALFGSGNEPTKEWIDENIEWFDGIISYINKDNLEYASMLTVRISPYSAYKNKNPSVSCTDSSNGTFSNYSVSTPTVNNVKYYDFTINSVTDDITCNIDWS